MGDPGIPMERTSKTAILLVLFQKFLEIEFSSQNSNQSVCFYFCENPPVRDQAFDEMY